MKQCPSTSAMWRDIWCSVTPLLSSVGEMNAMFGNSRTTQCPLPFALSTVIADTAATSVVAVPRIRSSA